MKKHFYCLFLAFLLVAGITFAKDAPVKDFSGCCKPPYDKTITCDQLPYDFNPRNIYQLQSLFGKAENKCYPGLWSELEPIVNLSSCETGTIIRRFQVSNNYGGYDICEQTVTIEGVHNYKIRFPEDKEVSCGQTPLQEAVIKEQSSCDYLVVSVQDQKFFDTNDQCGKIFRTYRVINWCEYDGQSQPIAIGRDEDCDGRPGDEQVWVIRRSSGIAYIDRDDYESNTNPRANERRTCTPGNPTGYWRTSPSVGYWVYTQHIKISDDVPPAISVTAPDPFCSVNNNCNALVEIPFSVNDICTPNDINIKVFVDGQKIAEYTKGGNYLASGNYKIGSHELEIHAIDGCGNPTLQRLPFTVVDCKAPAPTCLNGITITLMPTPPNTDADGDGDADPAAMSVRASDLLVSQISDCSGITGFSINREGEIPSPDQQELILTCDDLGTLYIEVYAWDKANNPYTVQPDGTIGGPNYAFCKTYILVQINSNQCEDLDPGMGSIGGSVHTEDNYGLRDVSVMLVNNDSVFQYTSASGSFRFDSIPMQADYKVVPIMDTNPTEGLSIADLILLQKHVLGIERIQLPYRLIAADVNADKQINADDITDLRNVLLGVQLKFTNNTSWRFIDVGYVFPNPLNPWQELFPEYISIRQLSNAENDVNFLALKTGDVNGSVVADRLGITSRSNETFSLYIADQMLEPGTIVEVPIYANLANMQALQFELQFDPRTLQLQSIDPGIVQSEHYSHEYANEGLFRVVWDNAAGINVAAGDVVLFTLVFRVAKETVLADAISLSKRWAPSIALVGATTANVQLYFSAPPDEPKAFALYQNMPNPFRNETVIRFQLPEAGDATLMIYDVNGKIIWQQSANFTKGTHEVKVSGASFSGKGLFFYALQTGEQRLVRRMLLIP